MTASFCNKGILTNKLFIKENHKETLAQVFTEVRYKKSDNECMSVTLKETLKKQGFEK